jgi:hypothetical protein
VSGPVELEVLRRGRRRLRCAVRGHRWRAVWLAGLVVVSCQQCGCQLANDPRPHSPPVDVTRDALDLLAIVLGGGAPAEYDAAVQALSRTPHLSVEVLARLLTALASDRALSDVRGMAVLHQLRDVEAVR